MNEVIEITKGHLAVLILLALAFGVLAVGMLWLASVHDRVKKVLKDSLDEVIYGHK